MKIDIYDVFFDVSLHGDWTAVIISGSFKAVSPAASKAGYYQPTTLWGLSSSFVFQQISDVFLLQWR